MHQEMTRHIWRMYGLFAAFGAIVYANHVL